MEKITTVRKVKRDRKSKRKNNKSSLSKRLSFGFPERFRCVQKYGIAGTYTVPTQGRFGIAQFWNILPSYTNQLFAIWKMCQVSAVTIKITVMNTTASVPAYVLVTCVPASEYPAAFGYTRALNHTKIAYLSGAGGLDRAVVEQRYTLRQLLGINPDNNRVYQQDVTDIGSTTPLTAQTPVIQFDIGGITSNANLIYNIEVWYDVEYFTLQTPGI